MSDSLSPREMPFVSVVMPAHNEEQYIAECLQSLNNQDYPADRFEIIVVDNNSTDRTAEIAKAYGATVLFKEQGPVGAVRNYGAQHAKGDIIAFIDSDCVAPRDWLSQGCRLVSADPGAAFGGGCYLREKPFFIEKFWLLSNNNEGTLPKHLIGATFFITKELFLAAGMFDETITSGEDTKLSEAIKAIGQAVRFSMQLNVAHLGNPTTVAAFFKRQVWHSENYLKDITASLRDPIFYIVVAFIILVLGSIILSPFAPLMSTGCLIGALTLPFILSIKRIKRAHYRLQSPAEILYIYYLDLMYVLGRCVGLIKGAVFRH